MKRNKKGFTLVELLAVIVILAIILVIAVPQIMRTIENTRMASLESTARLIVKSAEKEYLVRQTLGDTDFNSLKSIPCEDVVELDTNTYGLCNIKFDSSGKATVIINGKENGKFDNIACKGTTDDITCQEGEILPGLNCTFDGELEQGAEFQQGQYTYRYMQEYRQGLESLETSWQNIETEGWGVILTDKESTDPVNTPVCSYINDKPLVSTSNMFSKTTSDGTIILNKASEIDVSEWDTSNVINMESMFAGTIVSEIKGLSNLDTSNVTNMIGMFSFTKATSLDLRGLDTSNVTYMSAMFGLSEATSLDLRGWNTSKVIDTQAMFVYSEATNLDLSDWDTSSINNMSNMFAGCKATTIKFPNEWTTGENANLSLMFNGSDVTTIDFTGLDTSKVTDMSNMFFECAATTGYAKTQEDADKFNNSIGKPSTLTFIVK